MWPAPPAQRHRNDSPLYLPLTIFLAMQYDLSPEDRAAIAALLRDTIAADRGCRGGGGDDWPPISAARRTSP